MVTSSFNVCPLRGGTCFIHTGMNNCLEAWLGIDLNYKLVLLFEACLDSILKPFTFSQKHQHSIIQCVLYIVTSVAIDFIDIQ